VIEKLQCDDGRANGETTLTWRVDLMTEFQNSPLFTNKHVAKTRGDHSNDYYELATGIFRNKEKKVQYL
jgi:hypothetical protein